jgi:hypothetical protein
MLALASLMSSCKLAPFSSLFLFTPFHSSPSSITLKKKTGMFYELETSFVSFKAIDFSSPSFTILKCTNKNPYKLARS